MTVRGEELYSLRKEFDDEIELAGVVREHTVSPPPGALSGGVVDALIVALAPGGAASVAAAVVITWIRNRRRSVEITLRRPDRSELRFRAETVRAVDGERVQEITTALAKWLEGQDTPVPQVERDGEEPR